MLGLIFFNNLSTISAEDLGIGPFELADIRIAHFPNEPFSQQKKAQIIQKNSLKENSEVQQPVFSGSGEKLGENEDEIISVNSDAKLDPNIINTRIQVVLPNGSRRVISISAYAKISELYSEIAKE